MTHDTVLALVINKTHTFFQRYLFNTLAILRPTTLKPLLVCLNIVSVHFAWLVNVYNPHLLLLIHVFYSHFPILC